MLHPVATFSVSPLNGRDTVSQLLSAKLKCCTFPCISALRGVVCDANLTRQCPLSCFVNNGVYISNQDDLGDMQLKYHTVGHHFFILQMDIIIHVP